MGLVVGGERGARFGGRWGAAGEGWRARRCGAMARLSPPLPPSPHRVAPHVGGHGGPGPRADRCPPLLGPAGSPSWPPSCLAGGAEQWSLVAEGGGGDTAGHCRDLVHPLPPGPGGQGRRPSSLLNAAPLRPGVGSSRASRTHPHTHRVLLSPRSRGRAFFGGDFCRRDGLSRGVSLAHLYACFWYKIFYPARLSIPLPPQDSLALTYVVNCSSVRYRLTKSNFLPSATDAGPR